MRSYGRGGGAAPGQRGTGRSEQETAAELFSAPSIRFRRLYGNKRIFDPHTSKLKRRPVENQNRIMVHGQYQCETVDARPEAEAKKYIRLTIGIPTQSTLDYVERRVCAAYFTMVRRTGMRETESSRTREAPALPYRSRYIASVRPHQNTT